MKKFFVSLCVFAMLLGMVSCDFLSSDKADSDETATQENGGDTTQMDTDGKSNQKEEPLYGDPVTYPLDSGSKGIKVLGERCLASDRQLNCDWTGSGMEMDIVHNGGDITFSASATSKCYFRAYVDGTEWKKTDGSVYYTVLTGRTSIVLKSVPKGEHRIKLIKVTGYTIARAQLHSVTFAGTIKESAPADNGLYIEFVGDSISCGWGNIGTKDGAYTGQDGTMAYPLMVAKALNADYSVTALSGQGLLCGDPGMTEGYLYESALRSKEAQYAFERQADIVVINIGTNDYTKREQLNIDAATFRASYLAFLQTVIAKNGGDCIVYCLYNTMNDTFAESILSAVEELGGEADNIYTLRLEKATKGASGHPSAGEHEEYTQVLLEALRTHVN